MTKGIVWFSRLLDHSFNLWMKSSAADPNLLSKSHPAAGPKHLGTMLSMVNQPLELLSHWPF